MTRRIHTIAGLVSALAVAVAACSGSAAPSQAGVSKLSVLETTPGFFDIPLKVMMDEGIAAKHGLELSIAQFQAGSGSTSQIFAGGTGDIMMGGIDAPVGLEVSKTVDVQVIGDLLQRGVWQLVAKTGSPYTSLESLKGKVIGISGAGSFSDYALREALKGAGMTPEDVQIAALGNAAAQYAALEAGQADAVQLQAPILNTALRDQKVQVVYDFQKGLTPSLVLTARTDAVKANPAPYKAFMTALREALDKVRGDSTYAVGLAKKYYGADNSDADLQLILDAYLTDPGIWTTDGVYTQAMHDAGQKLMVDGSGKYTSAEYPTFDALTQYAPNSFK
jgi:ABC-type nitrate/sulfonate/bicarbonate transport system substrate-binding protein